MKMQFFSLYWTINEILTILKLHYFATFSFLSKSNVNILYAYKNYSYTNKQQAYLTCDQIYGIKFICMLVELQKYN